MYKKPVTTLVVYIGLVPYEWDEAAVRAVVCGTGKVVAVRMGFDYVGKNKGFCFVEYLNPGEAERAIPLLNAIKIVNPSTNQIKRLRIEASKEPFKQGATEKAVLPFDRSRLPPNVQLPPEINNTYSTASTQSNQQMPAKFTGASKVLPQPAQIPLGVPDKISETLSKIPPAQLIELIATLKNILSGPEALRAYEVFLLLPDLATCAAQALLVMGFIDEEVISESMKLAQQIPQKATPTPPPSIPQPPQFQQYPNQYQGQQFQNNHQFQNQPPQFQNKPYAQQFQKPQYGFGNFGGSGSKWPHLPQATQAKLQAMAPDQAELVAQVLSLPADQISTLPPDQQSMVTNLRAQYL